MRKIIHVDMDAFFAAVEQRDHPEWRGLPIVVGGPPDSRAVVCTASYEARKFGVRSAMPCSQAKRLCPQALFVPLRFDAYREASAGLHAIFRDYTDLIEPLSLDEAFLDVTTNFRDIPHATTIAREIRERVRTELHLTASAGVSYCKFLAKIASDLNKPDGLTVVRPEQALALIDRLKVSRFHGVGPVTEKRLAALGIHTGKELRDTDSIVLQRELGRSGHFLSQLARGIDERPVQSSRERKSVAAEDTFAQDVLELTELSALLHRLALRLAARLNGKRGFTVTLKIKYADFRQVTRSRSFETAQGESHALEKIALDMLGDTLEPGVYVRLLGIQVSHLEGEASLEAGEDGVWEQLELPLDF